VPDLVEDAGEPLSAGYLSRLVRLVGQDRGTLLVGDREVDWKLTDSTVSVTHAPADGTAAPVRDTIQLVDTSLPSGGLRWWWSCPGCRARVGILYLPAGRDRLACRTCCGLKYGTQYGKKRRPRKRRPILTVVRERLEWTDTAGWVTLRRQTVRR
jgi:hypothetical protein